jgi:hypothetical protein
VKTSGWRQPPVSGSQAPRLADFSDLIPLIGTIKIMDRRTMDRAQRFQAVEEIG